MSFLNRLFETLLSHNARGDRGKYEKMLRHLERNFMNHVEGIRIELFWSLGNASHRSMYQLEVS